VENLRDRPIRIELEDLVPVSEDERIAVKVDRETTPGYAEAKDKPGVLTWQLVIEPKTSRELTLQYTVRHPRDMVVAGM
jgi:hypothetical protein